MASNKASHPLRGTETKEKIVPSIHKNHVDDVRGQIIGGNYGEAWLTYEGRKQGPTHYVTSEIAAINACENWIEEKKAEGCFYEIYPNKNGWRVCIDGV